MNMAKRIKVEVFLIIFVMNFWMWMKSRTTSVSVRHFFVSVKIRNGMTPYIRCLFPSKYLNHLKKCYVNVATRQPVKLGNKLICSLRAKKVGKNQSSMIFLFSYNIFLVLEQMIEYDFIQSTLNYQINVGLRLSKDQIV